MKYILDKKNTRGFTMLYASIIGSLVLAIGLAILNVTVKQITLASASRESIKAFYNADTGIECAWYLDGLVIDEVSGEVGVFGIDASNPVAPSSGTGEFECANGLDVTINDDWTSNTGLIKGTFTVTEGENGKVCFDVEVSKGDIDGNGSPYTKFASTGYNNCNLEAPNRFARTLYSDDKPPE